MSVIQIKDKRFKTFIPEEQIMKEVARVADEINRDLSGTNPLFISVLNGSFMFTADLMKRQKPLFLRRRGQSRISARRRGSPPRRHRPRSAPQRLRILSAYL